ncbi:hypothetical protein DdX_19267 [Ditylenchus destructor]|uniref:Uncharacterized protein n=1 Tax=Ditylenchus destructor TaxID=166010 RepID=A0AAD4MMX2_9BILA|nr:hypothetical protein DdX_19267 [Ditylenchus destructor]
MGAIVLLSTLLFGNILIHLLLISDSNVIEAKGKGGGGLGGTGGGGGGGDGQPPPPNDPNVRVCGKGGFWGCSDQVCTGDGECSGHWKRKKCMLKTEC